MVVAYQRDMCGPSVIFPINQRASHLEMYLSTADKKTSYEVVKKAAIRPCFESFYPIYLGNLSFVKCYSLNLYNFSSRIYCVEMIYDYYVFVCNKVNISSLPYILYFVAVFMLIST